MSEVRSELVGIRSELGGVRSELDGMRSEQGGMRSELDGMKSELGGIKAKLSELIEEKKEQRVQSIRAGKQKSNRAEWHPRRRLSPIEIYVPGVGAKMPDYFPFNFDEFSKLKSPEISRDCAFFHSPPP